MAKPPEPRLQKRRSARNHRESRSEDAALAPPDESRMAEPVAAQDEAYQPPKWQPPAPTIAERPAQTEVRLVEQSEVRPALCR